MHMHAYVLERKKLGSECAQAGVCTRNWVLTICYCSACSLKSKSLTSGEHNQWPMWLTLKGALASAQERIIRVQQGRKSA